MTESTRTELEAQASRFETTLRSGILPYWRRTAVDPRHGGYRLRDYGAPRFTRLHRWQARRRAPKHLVGQARLVWTFAHAHNAGLDTRGVNLEAAHRGFEFLVAHFLDTTHGGWRWVTSREGDAVDERKNLYGQFMMMFTIVEYVRASGDRDAMLHAFDTFDVVERHLRDREHGGWIEGASRDWGTLDPTGQLMVGTIGVKSGNVYLHVMEALAELADYTAEPRVTAALAEAIDLTRRYFFPSDPSAWTNERNLDWSPVPDPDPAFSYGHAVEFAYLLLRAEQVLGTNRSWDFLFAVVDHTLHASWDHEHGGVFGSATLDGSPVDTDKFWWAQGEMMAALTDAAVARPGALYEAPLHALASFVTDSVADPRDGVWRDSVARDGRVANRTKAHDWIGGYHDTRALVKFCRAYGQLGAMPSDASGRT